MSGAWNPASVERVESYVPRRLARAARGPYTLGMSAERLRQLLEQVHAELETLETLDDESRELVLDSIGDLAGALERATPPRDAEHESLGERLEDAAKQFESEHPKLFTALQQIVDTLRGGGI